MKQLSREKNFVKNTFVLALGTFLPKLASFITLPIYTAYLTKDEYGTYDLITILCTLLLPMATLQIQSGVFRFLLDSKENKAETKSIITTLYVFVVPVSAVVLFVLYFIMHKLSPLLRILIVLYYFTDMLLIVTRQVARGMSLNHLYSLNAVIQSFLNMLLVVVFLVVFRTGLNGLVASLTIATTVSLICITASMHIWKYIDLKSLNSAMFKSIINYSWPMVPNSISLWIMRVSDRAIISFVMGTAANAVYAVANKIPTLLQLAQNTFSMAWMESASLSVKDKDADAYYTSMFHSLHRVLAGFAGLLMAFQPVLFAILIRGDYEDAYIHIAILILGLFFSNVAVFLGGIYIANMRTKSIGVTTVISAALNFLINIVFIHSIGIFAASLSTTISYLFLMIYRMIDIQKIQKIHYPIKEIIITDIILVVMCVLCAQRVFLVYVVNCVVGCILFICLNKDLMGKMFRMVSSKIHGKRNSAASEHQDE